MTPPKTVEIGAPRAHRQRVLKILFNEDGSRIATLGGDSRLAIWNTSDGRHLFDLRLEGSPSEMWSGTRRNDIIVLTDRSLRRYENFGVAEPILLRTVAKPLQGAALTDAEVALADEDGRVEAFSLENPASAFVIEGEPGKINSPRLWKNGNQWGLFSAWHTDPHIEVWDLSVSRNHGTLHGITGLPRPTGSRGGARLSKITIYGDVSSPTAKPLPVGGTIFAISPDGKWLAAATGNDSIYLWPLPVNPGNSHPRVLLGHEQDIRELQFSPDGKVLASADANGVVRIWEVGDQPGRVYFVGDPVRRVIYDSLGDLVAAPEKRSVWFFSGEKVATSYEVGKTADWPFAWATTAKGPVGIWKESRPASVVQTTSPRTKGGLQERLEIVCIWNGKTTREVLIPGEASLEQVAISQDGSLAAYAVKNGSITLVSVPDGSMVLNYQVHPERMNSLSFAPDSKALLSISVSPDGATKGATATFARFTGDRAKSLEISSYELPEFEGGISAIRWLVRSDAVLVVSNADGTVCSWKLPPGGEGKKLGALGPGIVTSISPDGQHVAVGTFDSLIRVYSMEGDEVTLRGHENGAPINSVAFSPSGKKLVSASRDQTARVWELPRWFSGQEITENLPLVGHRGDVFFAAFSGENEAITGSDDGTIRIWPLDWKNLLARMRYSTSDQLRPDVRQMVFGNR